MNSLPEPYFKTDLGVLYHGDCLEILPLLGPVDLVLTDPPYGKTACKWDVIIPFSLMWERLKQITKKNSAIVLFGNQPFTSEIVMSNKKMFKYEWIWEKNQPSGIALSKYQPMRNHETVLVFSGGSTIYNKQPTKSIIKDRPFGKSNGVFRAKTQNITGINPKKKNNPENLLLENVNPRTVIKFNIEPNSKGKLHPTQKPVALMQYLIKTYTNTIETVLDFTIGSGTTAVACERLGRKWIGIEIDEKYCEIAAKRIRAEAAQRKLF